MLAKTIFVIHYLKKVATRYLLFIIWKKLLRNKKKVSNDDICSSIWKKLLLFNKRKEKKRTCKSFQTTLHLMQQRWPGKKSCINSQTPKLKLLVKKKPQKNWFKQKQEVFFSFIYKKKRLANDQSSFFFFSKKIWGFRTWKQKSKLFHKAVWFCFPFFWQFLPLGLSWAKQKTTRVFCWKQNKRKEVVSSSF